MVSVEAKGIWILQKGRWDMTEHLKLLNGASISLKFSSSYSSGFKRQTMEAPFGRNDTLIRLLGTKNLIDLSGILNFRHDSFLGFCVCFCNGNLSISICFDTTGARVYSNIIHEGLFDILLSCYEIRLILIACNVIGARETPQR